MSPRLRRIADSNLFLSKNGSFPIQSFVITKDTPAGIPIEENVNTIMINRSVVVSKSTPAFTVPLLSTKFTLMLYLNAGAFAPKASLLLEFGKLRLAITNYPAWVVVIVIIVVLTTVILWMLIWSNI